MEPAGSWKKIRTILPDFKSSVKGGDGNTSEDTRGFEDSGKNGGVLWLFPYAERTNFYEPTRVL
jgi:hypothetical protein